MKIAEIFPSLQGEGKNQGKPCLFIRLAGCNLRCRWCDTPASLTGGAHKLEINVVYRKGRKSADGQVEIEFEQR